MQKKRADAGGAGDEVKQSATQMARWPVVGQWREAYKSHKVRKHDRKMRQEDYSDLFLTTGSDVDETQRSERAPLLDAKDADAVAARAALIPGLPRSLVPTEERRPPLAARSKAPLLPQVLYDSVARQAGSVKDWVGKQTYKRLQRSRD